MEKKTKTAVKEQLAQSIKALAVQNKIFVGGEARHIDEVVDDALKQIELERSGETLGLYTRWNKINRTMGKYWRFNHITMIAAPSGHGKSYAINMIHHDFTNPELNPEFYDKIVLIHFGYEMEDTDEVLRRLSSDSGKSYHYIISSESDFNNQYNKLSDEEFDKVKNIANKLKGRNIYYVSSPLNIFEMYYTVERIHKKHPDKKIVISLDHYLLPKKLYFAQSDDELIAQVAFMLLNMRKVFEAMIIVLGQTNQNIKSIERMQNPQLHFPNDSDIYRGSQINWVCDNIIIFPYRPELLNMPTFGPQGIKTKDLVLAIFAKSRKGILGTIQLTNRLKVGQFVEKDEILPKFGLQQ